VDKRSAIAIIQARMSSTRLPGKVLMPLAGKPVIGHIVERARACKRVGKIVVATSQEKSDDPLAKYCTENEIEIYRGSLNHVLSRYVNILSLNSCKYCVRITGDCPLISPLFIDAQIDALEKFNGDLIWMRKESSVLEGQGVISSKAIFAVNTNSDDPDDFEHVGSKYFLSHHSDFRYVDLKVPEKYLASTYRLTVDETKDYAFMSKLYDQLWNGVPIALDEALKWMDNADASELLNQDVQHSEINKKLLAQKYSFKPDLAGSFTWRPS
jgi:spore coat polysaccharide biosynthesis protein SpsF